MDKLLLLCMEYSRRRKNEDGLAHPKECEKTIR